MYLAFLVFGALFKQAAWAAPDSLPNVTFPKAIVQADACWMLNFELTCLDAKGALLFEKQNVYSGTKPEEEGLKVLRVVQAMRHQAFQLTPNPSGDRNSGRDHLFLRFW